MEGELVSLNQGTTFEDYEQNQSRKRAINHVLIILEASSFLSFLLTSFWSKIKIKPILDLQETTIVPFYERIHLGLGEFYQSSFNLSPYVFIASVVVLELGRRLYNFNMNQILQEQANSIQYSGATDVTPVSVEPSSNQIYLDENI